VGSTSQMIISLSGRILNDIQQKNTLTNL